MRVAHAGSALLGSLLGGAAGALAGHTLPATLLDAAAGAILVPATRASTLDWTDSPRAAWIAAGIAGATSAALPWMIPSFAAAAVALLALGAYLLRDVRAAALPIAVGSLAAAPFLFAPAGPPAVAIALLSAPTTRLRTSGAIVVVAALVAGIASGRAVAYGAALGGLAAASFVLRGPARERSLPAPARHGLLLACALAPVGAIVLHLMLGSKLAWGPGVWTSTYGPLALLLLTGAAALVAGTGLVILFSTSNDGRAPALGFLVGGVLASALGGAPGAATWAPLGAACGAVGSIFLGGSFARLRTRA